MPKIIDNKYLSDLRAVHSALDDALGDTDVEHMDDEELRGAHPVQWAAMRLAQIISDFDNDGHS
jgi:glycine cleavage system aminomethyltransferase T